MQAEYDALLEQLKWTHAILGILVELEGGVVELSAEQLENYSLDKHMRVVKDAERLVYRIEVLEPINGEIVEEVIENA